MLKKQSEKGIMLKKQSEKGYSLKLPYIHGNFFLKNMYCTNINMYVNIVIEPKKSFKYSFS